MLLSPSTVGALLLAFGAFKLVSAAGWWLNGGAEWVAIAFAVVACITVFQGLAMFNYLTNPFIETYVFAAIGAFLLIYYAPKWWHASHASHASHAKDAWGRVIVLGNLVAGVGFLAWAADTAYYR